MTSWTAGEEEAAAGGSPSSLLLPLSPCPSPFPHLDTLVHGSTHVHAQLCTCGAEAEALIVLQLELFDLLLHLGPVYFSFSSGLVWLVFLECDKDVIMYLLS